jgi:type II secretory pathway pseudopilin PulG
MIRKSHFTLLELLIVLFIISFGIILTGVKIKDLYQEQRFNSETQQVLSHLAMAQDLMLIMDTDVHVKFAPDPEESEKIQLWLEIEKPLKKGWASLIERKISLAAIKSIEFERRRGSELTLQFSLGKMSEGELVLLAEKEGKGKDSKQREAKIDLVGYPRPIRIKGTATEENREVRKNEVDFPPEVYEKLHGNPNAKDQHKTDSDS